MAHELKKTAIPVAPTLMSRIGRAAKNVMQAVDTPIAGRGFPNPNMPPFGDIVRKPLSWAGQMGKGYLQHAKRLGEPGGFTSALKDVSPLSLGLMVLPELTGQGVLSAVKDAPEGEKANTIGGALGGLLGGQLMWRTGLMGSLGGSYLGSRLGERVMGSLVGKKKPKQKPMSLMTPGQGVTPGTALQPSILGMPAEKEQEPVKVGERLPEVAGTSPSLSMGGPGREDVGSRGRVANRNNEYFGGDSLRNVGDLSAIFHTGRGLGSQGGQPYADGSIFRHLGLSPGGKVNPKSKRELGDSSLDSASSDYL